MTAPEITRILLVGPLADPDFVFSQSNDATPVVAIDGGLDVCVKAGVPVTLAVGDWDSLSARSRRLLKRTEHLTLPRRKDQSDLAAALKLARAWSKRAELVCLGVTGGLPDYQLASLLDLSVASEQGPVIAADEQAVYYFFSAKDLRGASLQVPVARKARFSVFALGGSASGVSITGAEYALKNASLREGSHGLSNVARLAQVRVSVKRGRLAVIVSTSVG